MMIIPSALEECSAWLAPLGASCSEPLLMTYRGGESFIFLLLLFFWSCLGASEFARYEIQFRAERNQICMALSTLSMAQFGAFVKKLLCVS